MQKKIIKKFFQNFDGPTGPLIFSRLGIFRKMRFGKVEFSVRNCVYFGLTRAM